MPVFLELELLKFCGYNYNSYKFNYNCYFVYCRTSGTSLYEILEIQKGSTADDIKKAYRKVCLLCQLLQCIV